MGAVQLWDGFKNGKRQCSRRARYFATSSSSVRGGSTGCLSWAMQTDDAPQLVDCHICPLHSMTNVLNLDACAGAVRYGDILNP